MRYMWHYLDSETCILHINRQVADAAMLQKYSESSIDPDCEEADFLTALTELEGVVRVSLGRYVIQLVKGTLFEWDPIQTNVLEMAKERWSPKSDMVDDYVRARAVAQVPPHHAGMNDSMVAHLATQGQQRSFGLTIRPRQDPEQGAGVPTPDAQ